MEKEAVYRAVTDGVEVVVTPNYEVEQSHPDRDFYFYSYQVCITNYSQRRLKLLSRHWIIRDGGKSERHVQGRGVIGLQPTIDPGYAFEYASACPLSNPYGNMRGYYHFQDDQHGPLKVDIPLFFLKPPHAPVLRLSEGPPLEPTLH